MIVADIDSHRINQLKVSLPRAKISQVNGLSHKLDKELNLSVGSVDIAVCNPPYQYLKKTKKHINLLEEAGFTSLLQASKFTTDILFLAQNLRMLKPDGELGIILPDTLLTGSDFEGFRKDLLRITTITSVIQLPSRIFAKTEASTHILVLKKRIPDTSYKVPIKLADEYGKITNELSISSTKLVARMDFNFHSFSVNKSSDSSITLKSIGAEIFRGKFSFLKRRHSILMPSKVIFCWQESVREVWDK